MSDPQPAHPVRRLGQSWERSRVKGRKGQRAPGFPRWTRNRRGRARSVEDTASISPLPSVGLEGRGTYGCGRPRLGFKEDAFEASEGACRSPGRVEPRDDIPTGLKFRAPAVDEG
jgi:hypothetical protein